MKIKNFSELETIFRKKKFLDVISSINYNISQEQTDVYQLELLGVCYMQIDLNDNAIIVFKHIKKKYPNFFQVNINYATALRKKGLINEAIKIYKSILKKKNKDKDALNNLGVAFFEKGLTNQAITYYKKAISIDKKFIQAYINLTKAYNKLKKYKLSSKILLNVIKKIDLKNDDIKDILANHYINNCNQEADGEKIYKNLINKKTLNYHVYHNYGYYLQNKNIKFDYALKLLNYAIKINENYYEAYNTIGIIYYKKGFLDLAIKYFEKSHNINKNYHLTNHNLGVSYIRKLIKLDIAWELRETRRLKDFGHYTKFPEKIWQGNFVDKLYLWNEQGIGDEILFLNTVYLTSKLAKKITIHLNYRLINFYNTFLKTIGIKNIKLLPLKKHDIKQKNYQIKNNDAHLSIGSLPKLFLNDLKKFDNIKFPYLINNKSIKIADTKIKIGLSWKTTNVNEQHRNINLNNMKSVLKNNNYSFYNLQFGDIKEDLVFFKKNNINFHYDSKIDYKNNFDYITGLINELDLVITIQNTVAHLCGAMNKKFIITLENNCRMNWGGGENNTPWYPSGIILRNSPSDFFKKPVIFSKNLKKLIKKALNN